ncbi:MAG TPA: diguanylate cyclase [Pyrinomonadaceae bacterium]|jgi:diguanylate cyclase (GGDEF)-like protein/putative nucleotidyltransferase with HDIG domain
MHKKSDLEVKTVKQFDLSEYSSPTKILGGVLLAFSAAALAYTIYGCFSFTFLQFVILGVSMTVAALANQYQFKIPKTRLSISPRKVFVFWGTIWLGVSGGVLLSIVSSAARYRTTKNKIKWVYGILIHTVSTFAAAQVFYLFLHQFASFEGWNVASQQINVGWFLVAAALMMGTHYLLTTLLSSVLLAFDSEDAFRNIWKKRYSRTIINYFVAFAAMLALHFSLRHFGVDFGLVVLPTAILGHLAYKIHLQRLAQKTREITEASRIHLATVEALATAIDARDQVGIGHVRRTQIYAVGIGEILGLSEKEINALRTGALLHDIGKLAVPDHILNKPGTLTPAEMEKMKIHASVGASILEDVKFDCPVVPTVKYHHEAWDGSGYPEGLKKENIPLTARILSIADAYDSLRGARPFRAAISRDEARKSLLNAAGTRFDPKLVDIFLRNLQHFEAEIEAQGFSYRFDLAETNIFGIEAGETNENYVEQIKRANREVFTLYELAKVFSSSLNLPDTLARFTAKIGELVPFDTCVVYLLDETKEAATAVYTEGKNSAALKGKRVKSGEGATGYSLKKRQPVYNINPALDFSFEMHEFILDYTAMASLPLIAEERLIGAVSLYSCDLENYEDEHMRLLETISRIAADAVSKSLHLAETESRALTDPMTGLPNARSLQMQFENEIARARRNGSEFQVLMLDLDGFKAVNDTFGHKVGDVLLREISKVMRGQLRDYDFLSRYAGDEFVIIVPEMSNEGVRELCQRMEKAVCDFVLPVGDGRFAQVGVSLGAAAYPRAGDTLDQIIVAADQAMYAVKAARKRKRSQPPIQSESRPQEASKTNGYPHMLIAEEALIVELDESHIISAAIN